MRYDLNSFTQIITFSFFVDHILIDASCGDVVIFMCRLIQKSFIVSQIEIGFMSVNGYIAFAMLVRIESTRIDIDIGI